MSCDLYYLPWLLFPSLMESLSFIFFVSQKHDSTFFFSFFSQKPCFNSSEPSSVLFLNTLKVPLVSPISVTTNLAQTTVSQLDYCNSCLNDLLSSPLPSKRLLCWAGRKIHKLSVRTHHYSVQNLLPISLSIEPELLATAFKVCIIGFPC